MGGRQLGLAAGCPELGSEEETGECTGRHAEHEVPDRMAGGRVQDGLNFKV